MACMHLGILASGEDIHTTGKQKFEPGCTHILGCGCITPPPTFPLLSDQQVISPLLWCASWFFSLVSCC